MVVQRLNSGALLVSKGARTELYARNLPAAAAAAGDPSILSAFDDDVYVPITPVMVRGDEIWFAEDDWSEVQARLLFAGGVQ